MSGVEHVVTDGSGHAIAQRLREGGVLEASFFVLAEDPEEALERSSRHLSTSRRGRTQVRPRRLAVVATFFEVVPLVRLRGARTR